MWVLDDLAEIVMRYFGYSGNIVSGAVLMSKKWVLKDLQLPRYGVEISCLANPNKDLTEKVLDDFFNIPLT